MQALSEHLSAPQSSPVFDKLLHPSDLAMLVTLLHPPLPATSATLSGLQVLDLSGQPMDIEQLADFRNSLLSVPQVLILKLCFHIPSTSTFPTTLVSQILCAFENLEKLFLQHLKRRNRSIYDKISLYFGAMLKSSPWLQMLDISGLIILDLRSCWTQEDVHEQMQNLASAVAKARHGSLRLNLIQINTLDIGIRTEMKDLNGMVFVDV
jgi:hypothetical protein